MLACWRTVVVEQVAGAAVVCFEIGVDVVVAEQEIIGQPRVLPHRTAAR